MIGTVVSMRVRHWGLALVIAALAHGAQAGLFDDEEARKRITLTESGGGHFMTAGQVNGRAVQFMVDTGATSIAMSTLDADRAGIAYKSGQIVQLSTANGVAQGWRVKLNSVRIGDVEVLDIEAVVTPQAMPFLLLGNSFLSRFQMRREGNLMTLDQRY